MARKRLSKKPPLEKFREIVEKCSGNLSNVAKALDVSRKTIWKWCDLDQDYRDVIEESRMQVFDKCLATAQALSLGIPDMQVVGEDEHGRPIKKMVGWVERPDSGMLRYFMSVYGRKEGFGENVDITTNGESINKPLRIVVVDNNEELKRLQAEDEKRNGDKEE